MSDFNVRSDSVDVEQIMRQIRARVREKRGSDYTEAELQQLATVKLEKFLDPRGVRSDLVEAFRKHHTVAEAPPNYEFEDTTLYESHRGFIRFMRKLFRPILKLFFNPDKITSALHIQAKVNTEYHRQLRQRDAMDPLFYEVIHNLVLETTRVGIEVQNLKMRVDSLGSRMDFDERRARSLEGVVEYKKERPDRPDRPDRPRQTGAQNPGSGPGGRPYAASVVPAPAVTPALDGPVQTIEGAQSAAESAAAAPANGPAVHTPVGPRADGERRRRRRRRRRRPGQTLADQANGGTGAAAGAGAIGPSSDQGGGREGGDEAGDFDGPDDGADDQ